MTHRAAALAFPVVLGLTCVRNPELVPDVGPLHLESVAARSVLGISDTLSIVFRLRNRGSETVSLTFTTSCQIVPTFKSAQSGQIVLNGWGCARVFSTLTLPPRGEAVRTILVRGGQTSEAAGLPLAPGSYIAYAELAHREYRLRSVPLEFVVRQ